ncbi:MAG: hypothetical protein ACXV3D_03410 [Halobacteriota archaeon]
MTVLDRFGINLKQIDSYDVLCLPENIQDVESVEQLYDTPESIDLCKMLKSQGLKCANSFDLGVDLGFKDRRAADLWLGTFWILQNAAIPAICTAIGTAVGTLAGIRFAKEKEAAPTTVNQTVIHLALVFPEADGWKTQPYDERLEDFLKEIADLARSTATEPNDKGDK